MKQAIAGINRTIITNEKNLQSWKCLTQDEIEEVNEENSELMQAIAILKSVTPADLARLKMLKEGDWKHTVPALKAVLATELLRVGKKEHNYEHMVELTDLITILSLKW